MSQPAKKKFYVVWKGRKTGIFGTWEQAKAQMQGFTGARYKAFPSLPEAERAFAAGYSAHAGKPASADRWLFAPAGPDPASYCVDAACSGSPGRLEYRGVVTSTGREFFHEGPFERGTNNVGEFLAIVHALQHLKKKKDPSPIYSDSRIALGWVRRKVCRTNLARDRHNAPLFDLIARAENWLKENNYPNPLLKWDTAAWGENPADFNRK